MVLFCLLDEMNGPTASLENMATDMALLPLQEVQEYQNKQRPLWTEAHSQDHSENCYYAVM